jgi:uncharacterized protein (TIGR01244 family)
MAKRHQLWMWLSGIIGSRYDGLLHFEVVVPGVLMRCGQPRVRELEEIRRRFGLRTIVCARGGTRHPLRGGWFRKEKAWCQQRGVDFIHIPFSDGGGRASEVFDRFVDIVRDPRAHPVLTYCEQGIHRAGILSAVYRLALMNWPLDRAVREMERLGFDMRDGRPRTLVDALQHWSCKRP